MRVSSLSSWVSTFTALSNVISGGLFPDILWEDQHEWQNITSPNALKYSLKKQNKQQHTFINVQSKHTQTHNLTVFWHSLSASAEWGYPLHPALPCPPLRWWPRLVVISVCGAPDRPSWASRRSFHQAVQNQAPHRHLVPAQCASPSWRYFGYESCESRHFLENRHSRT